MAPPNPVIKILVDYANFISENLADRNKPAMRSEYNDYIRISKQIILGKEVTKKLVEKYGTYTVKTLEAHLRPHIDVYGKKNLGNEIGNFEVDVKTGEFLAALAQQKMSSGKNTISETDKGKQKNSSESENSSYSESEVIEDPMSNVNPTQAIPGIGSATIILNNTDGQKAELSDKAENLEEQQQVNIPIQHEHNEDVPIQPGVPVIVPEAQELPAPMILNNSNLISNNAPKFSIGSNPQQRTLNTIGVSGTMTIDKNGNLVKNMTPLEQIASSNSDILNIDYATPAGQKVIADKLANIDNIHNEIKQLRDALLPNNYAKIESVQRQNAIQRSEPMQRYSHSQLKYLEYLRFQQKMMGRNLNPI